MALLVIVLGDAAAWRVGWLGPLGKLLQEQGARPRTDLPSIAVLPFTDVGGDPSQAYFAEGIAEDVITDLSKVSGLFVIARNSSFAYRTSDLPAVAHGLGVRYVMDGSVRRAGEQVRINVRLVDVATGGNLWAERFDGRTGDVFGLQDEIARKVVEVLAVRSPKIAIRNGKTKPGSLPRCPNLEIPAEGVFFQAQPNFIGDDEVIYQVTPPGGPTRIVTIRISIRAANAPGSKAKEEATDF